MMNASHKVCLQDAMHRKWHLQELKTKAYSIGKTITMKLKEWHKMVNIFDFLNINDSTAVRTNTQGKTLQK